MSMRVGDTMAPNLGGIGTTNASNAQGPVGVPASYDKIIQNLFGQPRPPRLELKDFPHLQRLFRRLNGFRRKFSAMIGDEDFEYDIVLADSTIAAIDEEGTIFMGKTFLETYQENLPVLLGVLAHEVGHRPKRMQLLRETLKKSTTQLTQMEIDSLCRHEEIRADHFAGTALAELQMPWEPLAAFIQQVQKRPHPAYLDGPDRAAVVADAHKRRKYIVSNRGKLFPEYNRHRAPRDYIGQY